MSAARSTDVVDAAAPVVREVGTTPPSNAPDLSMMSLITSFLAKEPVVTAGYAVTLLLATVVSIVGLSSITSKLYASINAGTRQTSMGLVLALGGMLCTLWGLNYGVDALDAHLRPSFQSFAYKSFLERIVKNNEEDFVDVPPLAYTNMTKVGTNTAMCIFTQMLRSYVPTAILVVVVTAFVLSINYKAGVAFIVALAAVGAIAAFVGPKVHAAAVRMRTTCRRCSTSCTTTSALWTLWWPTTKDRRNSRRWARRSRSGQRTRMPSCALSTGLGTA
jgi:hypothetical protein